MNRVHRRPPLKGSWEWSFLVPTRFYPRLSKGPRPTESTCLRSSRRHVTGPLREETTGTVVDPSGRSSTLQGKEYSGHQTSARVTGDHPAPGSSVGEPLEGTPGRLENRGADRVLDGAGSVPTRTRVPTGHVRWGKEGRAEVVPPWYMGTTLRLWHPLKLGWIRNLGTSHVVVQEGPQGRSFESLYRTKSSGDVVFGSGLNVVNRDPVSLLEDPRWSRLGREVKEEVCRRS